MSNRQNDHDDDLAYGEYHDHDHDHGGDEGQSGRGLFGDIYHRLSGKQNEQSLLPTHSSSSQPLPNQSTPSKPTMSFLDKITGSVHQLGSHVKSKLANLDKHSHTHHNEECSEGFHGAHVENRFMSFAPQREGNNAKWYVDACGYMWAVSIAIEQAKESIWILDWWLSPELYLRRPPSRNEQYRLDNMLKAAAERGVQVKVIVYKEVTQALSRKITPLLPDYLHSLFPKSTDKVTLALSKFGLDVIMKSLEEVEKTDPLIAAPITVSSWHTKHHLEDMHPNIAVIRHPDHLPDSKSMASSITNAFKNMKLSAATAAQLPGDALAAIYGVAEDSILYWAHHEKLCLVDGTVAFMGGLDLCYGRWDTNQHSIADAHPADINEIVFPGQDYNNSRVMDFQDVQHWENNKLDRRENSRMGWSDVSISLHGEVVEDLKEHFVQRWNFIFEEKMESRNDPKYSKLEHTSSPGDYVTKSDDDEDLTDEIKEKMKGKLGEFAGKLGHGHHHWGGEHQAAVAQPTAGNLNIQLCRSAAKWSNGTALEHSIANAYIQIIKNSEHFVYIENQFFITATDEKQKPVANKIGAAIVERIIRAAHEGQKYKIIVIMPAVPAFAGDLRADDALATRAIMEFQYDSINRGGHSIYEKIAQAGFNPMDYIRFYNLRNYDRINTSGQMAAAEEKAGVTYEEARKQADDNVGGGFATGEPGTGYGEKPQYEAGAAATYQQAAKAVGLTTQWDTVSSCYMLNGEDIRNVPWREGNVPEIDAFVTEELYIHSKLLIADDRIVICGSANLNDRSQLGNHDSEIAVIISGPPDLESTFNGEPFPVNRFATSLRREIFRKHLGLLKPQDYAHEAQNYLPVNQAPNEYDWGSAEDLAVVDPLNDEFLARWNDSARTNTEVFGKIFHPVPHDSVQNWNQYEDFYERFFRPADPKDPNSQDPKKKAGAYKVGHVVREEFPGGVAEVKELLSKVRGTLVEMPLLFLRDEDIAKEGVGLNALTEDVYT